MGSEMCIRDRVKEEISLLMNMVDDGEIYPSAAAQKILKKCIVETD